MGSASGMSIGQRIALYRRLRGLTQEGLAMRLHRSKSRVTKVERGERQIDSVTALLQVSKALGVEAQKLTGRARRRLPRPLKAVEDFPQIRLKILPAPRQRELRRRKIGVGGAARAPNQQGRHLPALGPGPSGKSGPQSR